MKKLTIRRTFMVILWAAMVPASTTFAQGPAYPSRPLTFLVPFAAGSATDQIARAIAASVTAQTKQPVIVDNRGGASGLIAAQEAARAAGDGYTVLITTNTTQAANPHLFKKLPYNPEKDFKPVTGLGRGGQVLVVRTDAPYKTVADFVARARAEPGKLSFGAGNSSSRVAGEMFKQLSRTDLLYVPYKSNPNAITDLLGGQIDSMVVDTITGLPHIESGKLRALGVSTGRRLPQLPGIPTIDEAGVKGYDIGYWFAAYLPATASPSVIEKLRELLVNATRSPEAKSFFSTTGTEAWTTTPEELRQFQALDSQKWGGVIRAAGIQPE
jgi:tripartite-type tricarboxylate transporter receptor subunit TctC